MQINRRCCCWLKSDKTEMMEFNLRGNKIESLRVEEHATAEIAAGNITAKSNESRQTAGESLSSFRMKDTTLHGARFLFTGNVFRRMFWTRRLSCYLLDTVSIKFISRSIHLTIDHLTQKLQQRQLTRPRIYHFPPWRSATTIISISEGTWTMCKRWITGSENMLNTN